MKKIIRVTTVPVSLGGLLKGQHRFMSSYYEIVGISSNGPELLETSKNEEIRVIPVQMTRQITPFQDLKSLYQLYKVFRKEKPFIVHSHTPKAGTLSMLAAKLAGVPNRLHTIAGLPLLEVMGKKRTLLNMVEKATYSCATMIYPNSFGLTEIIREHKFTKPSKLKVIANGSSNGIDTSFFDPSLHSEKEKKSLKKDLGIQDSDFVFVFVGRLVKDKGINELTSAFRKLNTQYKNAKLLLVGDYEKELDPLLAETEQEINTNPNVISVGWQKDVRPYFAISDILAFPSYREGFPNVVMQSGAMGLPSIVTDINGCNEIIKESLNGLIIPPKNSEKLLNAMQKVIVDPEFVKKMASNSRSTIQTSYEQSVVWNGLLEEYKSLEIIK